MSGFEILVAASSVMGTLARGQAAANQASFGAAIAEQQAARERQKAAIEEKRFRKQSQQVAAQQRARFARSGIAFAGSPLLYLEDLAGEHELDALTIRAQGLDRTAAFRNNAARSRMRGSAARTASFFRAGDTLLTAASKIG